MFLIDSISLADQRSIRRKEIARVKLETWLIAEHFHHPPSLRMFHSKTHQISCFFCFKTIYIFFHVSKDQFTFLCVGLCVRYV